MSPLGYLILLFLTAADVEGIEPRPTFKASFPQSPTSFEIDVDPVFIDETVQRVKLTRLPIDIDQPDLLDGPPVHNATAVRDYWINHYDWFAVQDGLNAE
jgi:hypothetical protein